MIKLADRLGHDLQLSAEQQAALLQGAALHDIGQLTVPDAVLLKPGPLSADERRAMQQHVQQGHGLASCIGDISPGALEVILAHHERWDGGGYPAGQAGVDIPLLARIFAVCDVYDVLLTARPYKPAWSREAALRELVAQAGSQFDPQVVSAFVKVIEVEQGLGPHTTLPAQQR